MERNDVGKKPGFAPSRAASDPAPRDGPVFPRVMGRLISFRNARHCAFPARRAGSFLSIRGLPGDPSPCEGGLAFLYRIDARHCAFPARRAGLFPCAGRLTLICIGRPAENFSVFPLDK